MGSKPKIAVRGGTWDPTAALKSIRSTYAQNILCSMATISPDMKPHINTAYYSYDDALTLYFLSEPTTHHAVYLERNHEMAVTIYDSSQPWGSELAGLQLFGDAHRATKSEVIVGYKSYAGRFLSFKDWITRPNDLLTGAAETALFLFRPKRIKIFDENAFGKDEYIDVDLMEQGGERGTW